MVVAKAVIMIIEELTFIEFCVLAPVPSPLSILCPQQPYKAGIVFTPGAQKAFCRDHKPDSQEVNWLWVLEALELSLALMRGRVLRAQNWEVRGIPGWLSSLVPAFGPGHDPGVQGSSSTSDSCMESASPSTCVSACLSLCVSHE